jgi:hypothetical protein
MPFADAAGVDTSTGAPTSSSQSSELVWDSGSRATAMSGSVAIPEGSDADWSPTLLLATAAGASVLSTFIDLAQRVHLPLLGLVTQQRVDLDSHSDIAVVVINVCVTVPSATAAGNARIVWQRALREAPVLKALACRVSAEPSIVVVSDTGCNCEGAVA